MLTMTVVLAWLADGEKVEGGPGGGTKPKDRDSEAHLCGAECGEL